MWPAGKKILLEKQMFCSYNNCNSLFICHLSKYFLKFMYWFLSWLPTKMPSKTFIKKKKINYTNSSLKKLCSAFRLEESVRIF